MKSSLPILLILATYAHHALSTGSSEFNFTFDTRYPTEMFGSIAGVDIDQSGNVYIFHRGSHVWDYGTFSATFEYRLDREDAIRQATVVVISPNGTVLKYWGANTFFMPHGLSLDLEEKHVWLTDVALHQVFKYTKDGSQVLAIGTPFVPDKGDYHFCQPTSVADAGDYIFVADGYCNSRIVMYTQEGTYIGEFGQASDSNSPLDFLGNPANTVGQPTFNIPHKVTYAKEASMLCVADRENGRIQCFNFRPKHVGSQRDDDRLVHKGALLNGSIEPKLIISDPEFGGRVFSIDYSPIKGGVLVAVSGGNPPLGFVYNVTTGQRISKFEPKNPKKFGMAHDLALTLGDAKYLYVADIAPVNLWRFSRHVPEPINSASSPVFRKIASGSFDKAISMIQKEGGHPALIWYLIFLVGMATIIFCTFRTRTRSPSSYSNSYPTSITSLFGGSRLHRKTLGGGSRLFGNMFSRSRLFNLFYRSQQQGNDFSQLPLDDSDSSDNDKSDSDVEEFNINKTVQSCTIDV